MEQCNQLTKTENCNSTNCKEEKDVKKENDEQKKKLADKIKGIVFN